MTKPWWEDFYDDHLAAALLDPAGGEEAERTVDFLVEVLDLAPGQRVFDQCCGTGRLSHRLARRGFEVIGIDLAGSYIERAIEAAPSSSLPPRFEAADAFQFVATPPCHAAVNWWTSFGYAPTDNENLVMLARAYDSLVLGGRFALDTMNAPQIYRHFQPEMITKRATPEGELTLIRTSKIDLPTNTLHKLWHYHLPDGTTVQRRSAVRLYSPAELATLLLAAGFDRPAFFGNIDGAPLSLDSPRCIVVASKKP